MRRTVPGGAFLAALAVLIATAVAALASEDPYRPQQWGLERVGAPEAWARTVGAQVVVAVLDTGVDLGHPDLRERLFTDAQGRVVGRDFVDDDDDPQDENGHGTMVAGIALATADNGEGIAGTAPGALLMPVRVLAADGSGRHSDLDRGIRWAVDAGADVINLSLERADEPPTIDRALGDLTAPVSAVRYAWDRGVVVVAAAGNSGNDATDYPEDSPVLLVGASDREDRKTGFSDAGRSDSVVAPGVDIVSTWCDPQDGECSTDRRYGVASGTSFAAPFVTGAVALLRAQGLDHRQTVERIRETARDLGESGPDRDTGFGLVDVAAATGPAQPVPTTPAPDDAASGDDVSSAEQEPPTAPTQAPSPTPEGPTADTTGSTASPADAPSPSGAPAPSDPSPIAAPPPVPSSDRAAWLGLATVVLVLTAGAVAVNLYRHGGAGFPGASTWGRPGREVKFRH